MEVSGLGKLVLVMRDTTERPEAVDVGMVLLVGADRERIEQSVSVLMDDSAFYEKMSNTLILTETRMLVNVL